MTGETIGSYRVVRKLGQGGMGTVFQAVDTMLEREVALKVLRPEFAGEPELADRFRTEAVILAKLNHPNIATLYGLARHGEQLFMVMEFVRGAPLDDVIRREGRVSPRAAAGWGCQVLDAMAYAHRQGVVHRDIKPANLMVTEEDTVKVMDFGIARVLGSAHQTRHGHVIGTASYMAPEQIRGEDVDGRADLYALGVVLYQLVTGVPPFKGSNEFAVMSAQLGDLPMAPSRLVEDLPGWFESAVLRALQKDRAARFQTASAFRAELEEGLRSAEASRLVGPGHPMADAGEAAVATLLTPASSPALPPPVVTRRRLSPRRLLLATLALGVVAGLGVTAWLRNSNQASGGARDAAAVTQPAAASALPAGPTGSLQDTQAPAVGGQPTTTAKLPPSPPPAAGSTGPEAGVEPGLSAQMASEPPPAPVSSAHAAPKGEAEDDEDAAVVEPESFDAEWLHGTAATEVVLALYPDHLALVSGDEKVLKSVRYVALGEMAYSENAPVARKRSGLGAVKGGVGRLFGAGKHWLRLQAGGEEILLRVGRSYKDIFAILEKGTGRKVKTARD